MDSAVVQQFLDYFQDFIDLCQWEDFPNNESTAREIKNAFLISQHVANCLDRFQKNNMLNEFLSILNNNLESSSYLVKGCLSDPPKYILKRIVNSNTKIEIMDVGFKVFVEIFKEDKLEACLTEFMLEAASKQTLLINSKSEIPKEKIVKFKSVLFLSQVANDSKESIQNVLKNCKQDDIDMFVVSLGNTEFKYSNSVHILLDIFVDIMISRDNCYKNFWRLLFNVEEKHLIEMCIKHSNLFMHISEALLDCGKLLRENMSAEYFYIEFTYSELLTVVRKINNCNTLKSQFFDIVKENDMDNLQFWESIIV